MNRTARPIAALAMLLFGLLFAFASQAQMAMGNMAMDKMEPGKVIVAIYHVAPGKHLEFLKWMATRDAVSKEAGVGDAQWYAHMDGDSWDYISISPVPTDEQDKKVDEISKSKGLTTGFKSSLEFRTMINSHTDTYARGPTTAAALVDLATK
jgi:hypothetical protein